LREFVELFQKLDGALEHARKIEQRMRLERALILPQRHGKNPPDPSRHHGVQVAPESTNRIGDERRQPRRTGAMPPPGIFGVAISRAERSSGKPLSPGFTVLCQEI